MKAYPLMFRWSGSALVPKVPRLAERQFEIGKDYFLAAQEERSVNSHRHYFAALHDAWGNLPEDLAVDFPTVEHLRKYCLIKTGFCDQRELIAGSHDEARRIAAFIRPADTFAVVTVNDCRVTVYNAKSQSIRARGKKVFQKSKTAVLDAAAALIGASVDDLQQNASRVA